MKIIKLVFYHCGDGYHKSTNKAYEILKLNVKTFEACFSGRRIATFETLEQAKEACQDHFEKFILSQVENDHIMVERDMVFNPRLLGYTEVKQTKLGQTRYDNPETLSFMVFDPVHNHWNIFFKNLTTIEWVYIPNHNFGVKLVSIFLGEKTDAN